ncbi:MAG TPA: response regulator transcription factor [Actinomycetota bacterium]
MTISITTLTTVLIVDPQQCFAEALGAAVDREPDLRLHGIASTLAEAIDAASAERPDVVVTEAILPDGDCIDVAAAFDAIDPPPCIIVLSGRDDTTLILRAVASSVCGFLPKTCSLGEILRVVRGAGNGGTLIDATFILKALDGTAINPEASRDRRGGLTEREAEVLMLMGDGLDAQSIATRLMITIHTARSHIKSILAKLHVNRQVDAILRAQRDGLIAQ